MFNIYGEFDMRAMSGVTDKPPGSRSAIASSPTQEDDICKPQQKPKEPSVWTRVVDEALVTHHLGVAEESDDYATAKRKLNLLLAHAQDIGAYFATHMEGHDEKAS